MYNPDSVGQTFMSKRGRPIKQRKYHLTQKEIEKKKKVHDEYCASLPEELREKAGYFFFNPYRRGMYWAQLQALYELGANEWHEFKDVLLKIQEIAVSMPATTKISGKTIQTNQWENFRTKEPKTGSDNSKDVMGRIKENYIFMQRLSCHHPSGFKLRQAHASVDLKKVTKEGFPHGIYYYRLSTYRTEEESVPVRDFSEYVFEKDERHYYTYKFVGKIITRDKTILEGIEI